jgi:Enoyl-CoA hydratase/isomerase
MSAPVLTQNNVGMEAIFLNSAKLTLPVINSLYFNLRNAEVNNLKRVVTLAQHPNSITQNNSKSRNLAAKDILENPLRPSAGSLQLSYVDMLFMCESMQILQDRNYAVNFFKNLADLSYLLLTYRKPLLNTLNSNTLVSFYATESSKFQVDPNHTLFGGLSHRLSSLPFHLGQFLLLTGHRLKSSDLVYADLSRALISLDATEFLSHSSAEFLEVSESNVREILTDHHLDLDPIFSLADFLPLIDDCFSYSTIDGIKERLKDYANDEDNEKLKKFASWCLQRFRNDLVTDLNFELVRRSKSCGLSESLRLENRVSLRLLQNGDFSRNLFRVISKDQEIQPTLLRRALSDDLFKYFEPLSDSSEEYTYYPRSESSTSIHPRFKQYSVDFDPKTGLDYDPDFMRREQERWSENFLADLRQDLEQDLYKYRNRQ